MTFQTTVKDSKGNPIPYAIVMANIETTGQTFTRGTDGGGYADVALFGVPAGVPVTLSVQAAGFVNHIEYPTTTTTNQVINVTLTSFKKPFPLAPTRDEVCNGVTTQQGLLVNSNQFGQMPWWGGAWAWLTPEDRQLVGGQLLANGDTICLIQIPDGPPLYDEPAPNFYSADKFPALDLTNGNTDMTPIVGLVEEAIQMGFKGCWVFLGGDDGNNGYPIAIKQTNLLGPALAASKYGNLNAYVMQVPGWDGVFYGYEPVTKITDFANQARAAGAMYVGLEHSTGHIPLGEGVGDYLPGGRMTGFDVILGEFNDGQFDDTVWQILARMIGPAYKRPPDQPAGDDPNPPFYMPQPSPRGPFYYRVFEFGIYGFVRGISPRTIQNWRNYFKMCGASNIC